MSHDQPHQASVPRAYSFRRLFDAPRDAVFQAWVNSRQLAQWWGPEGFTNPVCTLDARPGGAIHVDMRSPEGVVYPMGGTYREISEPARLVFTSAALDAHDRPLFEVLNIASFAEVDGETDFHLDARLISTTPEAEQYLVGMSDGWAQSLDRLASFLRTF